MKTRALVAVLLLLGLTCGRDTSAPLVVVIGLDGGSFDMIDELVSEGRLPAFERLIRSGVSGPLQSFAARRLLSDDDRRGFWSPIVWSSIATGKVPEKHGIRDFVLPLPGTATVWIGSWESSPQATIRLPELGGRGGELELRLRLRSFEPVGEQTARVEWNGANLAVIRVPPKWTDLSVPLSRGLLRPVRNELELVFSRQSSPSEHGLSDDRRPLAAELASLELRDERGNLLFALDPVRDRDRLVQGFHPPQAKLTEVQSVHWRAKPFWSLLSERNVPVNVIGYWATWPAYRVNGRLVSSRMGIREQRIGSKKLTWPPELASELEAIAPDVQDLEPLFDRLHVSECEPRLIDKRSVLKKILIQDEFYFRIARRFLENAEQGLYTVYFRAIDVAAHAALHWRNGAPLREGCPESVREVVDKTYVQVDRWLGELLAPFPADATVLVVSDHGMRPGDNAGYHAPLGVLIARGPRLRAGARVNGASVLDVAPTALQLFEAPIPLDMDGKVLAQLFAPDWLNAHPARYSREDSSLSGGGGILDEGTEDALEELRALGYIEE